MDGYQNTSVGSYALGKNQTSEAINNTVLGFKSIQNNLSGKYNTDVGALSPDHTIDQCKKLFLIN